MKKAHIAALSLACTAILVTVANLSVTPESPVERSPLPTSDIDVIALEELQRVAANRVKAEVSGADGRVLEQIRRDVKLRLVSSVSFDPISGGSAYSLGIEPKQPAQSSDGAGRTQLAGVEHNGEVLAVATAPGYCRRMVTIPSATGEVVVGLHPCGSLEVRVVNERGDPLEGVAVKLLPPDEGGAHWGSEWTVFQGRQIGIGPEDAARQWGSPRMAGSLNPREFACSSPEAPNQVIDLLGAHRLSEVFRDCIAQDEWTQLTDEEGLVTWFGLPAHDGYQWGAPKSRVIQYEPTQEVRDARIDGDRIRIVSDEPSPLLSGSFSVKAGELTSLGMMVASETALKGSVPLAEPEQSTRVVVKLFNRDSPSKTAQQGFEALSLEQSVWAGTDGSFWMSAVEPGRKIVRAWWRSEGGHVYFAERRFELLAGENKDIGALYARLGRTIKVTAGLVDGMGRLVQPKDELAPAEGPQLVLAVVGWEPRPDVFPDVDERLELRFDQVLILHGLPQADLVFGLDWSPNFVGVKDSGTTLKLPAEAELGAESGDELHLAVKVLKTVRQHVEAQFPEGVNACRAEVHLVSREKGSAYHSDLRVPRNTQGKAVADLEVPAGRYLCYVHTHTLEEPNSTASYYFVDDVVIAGDGDPLLVDLEQCATLDVQAIGLHGLPRAGEYLFVTWGPFHDALKPAWTHKVKTDSAGRFSLRGLVPQAEFLTNKGVQFRSGLASIGIEQQWKW